MILIFAISAKAQKTPLEFNDFIASITDSLNEYGRAWGGEVKGAFETNDFNKLTEKRRFLERYIDNQIVTLKGKKDVKNSTALRHAMIAFLSFEKNAIVDAMKPFEKMNASTTEETKKKAIEQLTTSTAKEEEELAKVGAEQAAYAKANGFPLEANFEEEEK